MADDQKVLSIPLIKPDDLENSTFNYDKTITKIDSLTSTQKYINLLGISDSLRYLHDSGIVHMNLKPENILFDENYYPHVSDYYISKCFPKFFKETLKLTIKGQNSSSIYYPPEIFLGGFTCDQSIDVFSFAGIMYELATGKAPFDKKRMDEVKRLMIEGKEGEEEKEKVK